MNGQWSFAHDNINYSFFIVMSCFASYFFLCLWTTYFLNTTDVHPMCAIYNICREFAERLDHNYQATNRQSVGMVFMLPVQILTSVWF